MTAFQHTEELKQKAVQDVISAGNYSRYKDELNASFNKRFVENHTPMFVTNIKNWVNEQIAACRHAFQQDQACVD